MDVTSITNYLNSWGQEVITNAKLKLRAGGKGGALEQSINFKVKPDEKGFVVQFSMLEYGQYMDKGVKGAGGEIKTGKNAGTWGGRRYYTTWEGKRKDSPYQYGSGRSSGSIYKGIGSFIKKKGLKGRDSKTGRYITNKSLEFAIVKTIWVKGIHGISFFQEPLGFGMKKLIPLFKFNLKEDILNNLSKTTLS